MKRAIVLIVLGLTAAFSGTSMASAQDRLALVVGQGAYQGRHLPTAANDAGLIAQTLTGAGFEVIQGRDLEAGDLRNLVRDFLDKAQDLEPGSTVLVYLAGHGVQLEGENYLLPVDARIERDVDVPIEGFRLSDLVRSLERSPAKIRVVVADMARDYPLGSAGEPVAKGLALMEPPSGFLVAFSSAPNILAADGPGPYGAYATALAEMIRQPGLPLDEVFARTRLRTHEATNGLQIPWHSANIGDDTFIFFEQAEAAATPLVREVRRIEDLPAEEAYAIAVERDTIQDYQAFLRRYPDHRLARRVTALLAARREAVVWRRTLASNTREAYWTYLRIYPKGPHAADSRRRLARLSAPYAPPESFREVIYDDLPPPLPAVERIEVVEVVTIIRDAPPPPRLPLYLLPPRDEDEDFITIIREPPPPPVMAGVLPIPMAFPVPMRARPPRSYYQPIAPRTSRGPVVIPVNVPRAPGVRIGEERNPRRDLRGEQPRVPRQPGLAAPIEPIPVSVRPGTQRDERGRRPGEPPHARPVLPSRPIPIPQVGTPRLRSEQPEPAGRPDRVRDTRPEGRDRRDVRREAPARDTARPRDPRIDAGEVLPRAPRPDRPRVEVDRERPDRNRAGRDPDVREQRNRPSPRPDVDRPAREAPVARRRGPERQQPEERRSRRDADSARPQRPFMVDEPRPRRARDERPAATPAFQPRPTVQARPEPRRTEPEMGRTQPNRPAAGSAGGRRGNGNSERCRPGRPCAEQVR